MTGSLFKMAMVLIVISGSEVRMPSRKKEIINRGSLQDLERSDMGETTRPAPIHTKKSIRYKLLFVVVGC